MTRSLLDRHVPLASLPLLVDAGHDGARVEGGESDLQVLERARAETRVLIAIDRGFGLLATRAGARLPSGIIYFRGQPATPESSAVAVLAILDGAGVTLDGRLTVVRSGRIRQRPIDVAEWRVRR